MLDPFGIMYQICIEVGAGGWVQVGACTALGFLAHVADAWMCSDIWNWKLLRGWRCGSTSGVIGGERKRLDWTCSIICSVFRDDDVLWNGDR